MIVGIALDDWKIPVFRELLTKAGYSYEDAGPITGNSTLLKIETDDVAALAEVVRKCEQRAKEARPK